MASQYLPIFYKNCGIICFGKAISLILEAKLVSMPTYHSTSMASKKVQTEADTLYFMFKDYLRNWETELSLGVVCPQCGSCTVLINGSAVTSCMLA